LHEDSIQSVFTTEVELILQEETVATTVVNGEVVMSNFVDVKRNLFSSFPSLHNTPCFLGLSISRPESEVECIDTFKLSCGFLDFFFLFDFFLREIGPCGLVPPPPLEWISSPPLVVAVLITTKGDEFQTVVV